MKRDWENSHTIRDGIERKLFEDYRPDVTFARVVAQWTFCECGVEVTMYDGLAYCLECNKQWYPYGGLV